MLLDAAPPIFLFMFYTDPLFNSNLKWSETLFGLKIPLGLPIPVPLLPDTFGIVEMGDKDTFTIRTEKFGDTVMQRGMNHDVEAKFVVRKSSMFAQIILPLVEKLFEFMNDPSKDYDVSYLNGETLIFNGRISDFQKMPNAENNDLLDIVITITTNPSSIGFETLTDAKETVPSIPKGGNISL